MDRAKSGTPASAKDWGGSGKGVELSQHRVEDLIASGVLEIGDGYRAKNSELGSIGVPFARAANINDGFHFKEADRFPVNRLDRVGNKVSRPGDVVFTSKGTVGRFAFVTERVERFMYSPQLCFWRSLKPRVILPKYLYYWMQSDECLHQINYLKGQTDMADYVSLRDQRRMKVSFPDADIQDEISTTLGALDDKITLLRETNSTLEAIAQALFKSWFVDFDPVRAKAEGRDPEGVPPEVADLFPSEFEDSELGAIPKGWSVGKVSTTSNLSKQARNPLNDPETEFEHYSLPAFDLGQLPTMELGGSIKSNKFVVHEDAVLLSKLNPHIPRLWLPSVRNPSAAVSSTEFLVLRPTKGFPREWVYLLLGSERVQSGLRQLVTGTSNSHQRVKPDNLMDLVVVIPPHGIIQASYGVIAPLLQRISEGRAQNAALAQIRDTLLPRLMSGKIPAMSIRTIQELR